MRRSQGLAVLSTRLEQKVRAFLTRYRLAGYDLEIRPPAFVPLELDLQLCVIRSIFARRGAGGAGGDEQSPLAGRHGRLLPSG